MFEREDPDLAVDDLLNHELIAGALAQGDSTPDLAGVLRELSRLGEWTLGGHDDWMVDPGDVCPVLEVVCTVRLRAMVGEWIVASGPHATAAALRCLLKALRLVTRVVEDLDDDLAELLG